MCSYDGEVDWNAYVAKTGKEFALMAHIAKNEKMQESEDV